MPACKVVRSAHDRAGLAAVFCAAAPDSSGTAARTPYRPESGGGSHGQNGWTRQR
jgi:hypothetical protein